MRNAVIKELYRVAESDPNVMLVVGDLGYGVVDEFKRDFPNQYVDAGISEQGMMSLAAGLAKEGREVYVYSIGNFPTLRCLEQIRNDVCEPMRNVKIIAVGSGFPYGQLGMSHHATEDIAALRALPGMQIFSPADPFEGAAVLRAAHDLYGPCYIRLAKGGESNLHPGITTFNVYRAIEVVQRGSVNFFTTGAIAGEVIDAAERLRSFGIRAGVYIFPSVKPLDTSAVESLAGSSRLIVTVEEHNILGGFGSAVAEIVAGMEGERASVIRLGLPDTFAPGVGDADWLRAKCGINADAIVELVKQKIWRM